MRKRQPIAPTAPKTAHRPRSKPSSEAREARIRELTAVARKGETPEEIIAKGLALQEIKRLKPWKDEGMKGGFGSWAKRYLPYRAARANQYIRIATNLTPDAVAHSNLYFEVLLQIAKAPVDRRAQVLKDALAGTSTRELRRAAQEKAPAKEPPGPVQQAGPADQVLRLQEELCAELRKLTGQALPAEVLTRIRAGGAQLAQLHAGLCGTPEGPKGPPPPPDPLKQEPEMDPQGSTSAPKAPPPPGPKAPPPPAPTPDVDKGALTGTGGDLAGPALQLPPEVLAFRPLFRFFHEELTPGRQDVVQYTLVRIVEGADRRHYLNKMYRSIFPFVPMLHPAQGELGRFFKALQASGMAGRKFALYCLIAARLPGMPKRLLQLTEQEMELDPKGGLGQLARYYRNLILGMS